MQNTLPPERRWSWVPWLLVALWLAWNSQGCWPFTAVEGDDQGVMFGVTAMATGDARLLPLRYLYEVQPGAYQVLSALVQFTGAPVETVFGWVSVAGALAFAVAGACLLREFVRLPLGWALLAVLAAQEVTTEAFYCNTSAVAGGLALTSVLLASRGPAWRAWLPSGIALAVAGWLRADSLLIAPACLAVAYARTGSIRNSVRHTTAIALCSVLALVLLYATSGISLANALGAYVERSNSGGSWATLAQSPFMVLSPALALAAFAGLAVALGRRETNVLALCALGCVPSIAIYGGSLATLKYFYYLVPFALVPAVYVLKQVWAAPFIGAHWTRRALLLGLGASLALVDQTVGLRTLNGELRMFTTAPTSATLVRIPHRPRPLECVIGPGELERNEDGFRIRTGQGFAPVCWHREKLHMLVELQRLADIFATPRDITVYWSNWLPAQVASRELLRAGFRPQGLALTFWWDYSRWTRGLQTVHLLYLGYVGSPYQDPRRLPRTTTARDTYFLGDYSGKKKLYELPDGLHWHLLSVPAEGFTTLFQRY